MVVIINQWHARRIKVRNRRLDHQEPQDVGLMGPKRRRGTVRRLAACIPMLTEMEIRARLVGGSNDLATVYDSCVSD